MLSLLGLLDNQRQDVPLAAVLRSPLAHLPEPETSLAHIRIAYPAGDEQVPFHERAQKYLDDPSLVRAIVADGCERAKKLAEETMREVREAMGLSYT